jgi:hypothetical protein
VTARVEICRLAECQEFARPDRELGTVVRL